MACPCREWQGGRSIGSESRPVRRVECHGVGGPGAFASLSSLRNDGVSLVEFERCAASGALLCHLENVAPFTESFWCRTPAVSAAVFTEPTAKATVAFGASEPVVCSRSAGGMSTKSRWGIAVREAVGWVLSGGATPFTPHARFVGPRDLWEWVGSRGRGFDESGISLDDCAFSRHHSPAPYCSASLHGVATTDDSRHSIDVVARGLDSRRGVDEGGHRPGRV